MIKSAAFEDEAKYMFEAEDKRTSGKLIIEGTPVAVVVAVVWAAYRAMVYFFAFILYGFVK